MTDEQLQNIEHLVERHEEQLRNIEHLVERHEEAVNQDTKDIEQLKRGIALIAEALEKFDVYQFRGLGYTPQRADAIKRFHEIVDELQANHTPKK